VNRALGMFLAVCLVWGLTWIPVKFGSEHVPPIMLAALRFSLASPLILLLAARSQWFAPAARLPRVLFTGFLMNTLCYALLVTGLQLVATGLAAIVNMALIPVFVSLFGAIHGEERLNTRRAVAIGLGIAGLLLLYAPALTGRVSLDAAAATGLVLIVTGTASYAWGAVLSRPLVRVFDPVVLAAWQTAVGGAGLWIAAFVREPVSIGAFAGLADWRVAACLAFLVIGGSLVGFTLYVRLLRDWGAFRAGLYAFVSPVIAVVAGILVLGEPFGWNEALGGLIMFAAAALAVSAGRPAARADG